MSGLTRRVTRANSVRKLDSYWWILRDHFSGRQRGRRGETRSAKRRKRKRAEYLAQREAMTVIVSGLGEISSALHERIAGGAS